uniref:PEST proteolytic signal-containing nuclear protein n=1 Tax=Cercocebus atys TaxID=9531 RepID=A0A2K5LUZ3_CERAT
MSYEGKAGEEKPEKPQRAGAAGGPEEEGKVPVTALRSNQLKKQLPTSQQSLQRSPSLELP